MIATFLIYCHLTFLIAYHSVISIFLVFSKPVIELIQLIFSAQRIWTLISSYSDGHC